MFTPQSALYGMRGMFGDGAPYRNRSGEQLRGYSGSNPNLPLNNQRAPAMPQFSGQAPGASSAGMYGHMLDQGPAMGNGAIATVGQLMGQNPAMPTMPGSMPGAAPASMQAGPQMPTPVGGPQPPGYGNMSARQPMPSKPMFIRHGQQRRAVMPIMGPRNAY